LTDEDPLEAYKTYLALCEESQAETHCHVLADLSRHSNQKKLKIAFGRPLIQILFIKDPFQVYE